MFNGDFEEEKKARGTRHIAMGNGSYYGQPARLYRTYRHGAVQPDHYL